MHTIRQLKNGSKEMSELLILYRYSSCFYLFLPLNVKVFENTDVFVLPNPMVMCAVPSMARAQCMLAH